MSEYKGIGAFYLPSFIPTDEWPDINVGHEGACGWMKYTPERTCYNDLKDSDFGNVWPIPHFKCSSCGGLFASYEFDYCPCCGAKVVER